MPRITLAHHRSHEILDSVEIGSPTWHLGERVAPQDVRMTAVGGPM
jgi:hypothetical protein